MSGLAFGLGGTKRPAAPAPKKAITVGDLFSADSSDEEDVSISHGNKKQRPAPKSVPVTSASSSDGSLDVMKVADKLAEFVAKNGRSFEDVTRERNSKDSNFGFLYDKQSPGYKYYEAKLQEFLVEQTGAAPASTAPLPPHPPHPVPPPGFTPTSYPTPYPAPHMQAQGCHPSYPAQPPQPPPPQPPAAAYPPPYHPAGAPYAYPALYPPQPPPYQTHPAHAPPPPPVPVPPNSAYPQPSTTYHAPYADPYYGQQAQHSHAPAPTQPPVPFAHPPAQPLVYSYAAQPPPPPSASCMPAVPEPTSNTAVLAPLPVAIEQHQPKRRKPSRWSSEPPTEALEPQSACYAAPHYPPHETQSAATEGEHYGYSAPPAAAPQLAYLPPPAPPLQLDTQPQRPPDSTAMARRFLETPSTGHVSSTERSVSPQPDSAGAVAEPQAGGRTDATSRRPGGEDTLSAMEKYMQQLAEREAEKERLRAEQEESDARGPRLKETAYDRRKVWSVYKSDGSRGHHMQDFIPPEELAKLLAKGGDKAVADALEQKHAIKSDNIGHKLLSKMGWKEGEAIGSSKTGITAPVTAGEVKQDNRGLGAAAHTEIGEGDDVYEQYRKRMMIGYKYRPNPLGNPRKSYY